MVTKKINKNINFVLGSFINTHVSQSNFIKNFFFIYALFNSKNVFLLALYLPTTIFINAWQHTGMKGSSFQHN